jgi:L-ascorbate metabolism protein UlaG (beta-lactamase superfamily)
MEIVWYGHSCFRLSERGAATVVTDPYDKSLGLSLPRLKADVVTISHDAPDHNYVAALRGEARVLTGPGEYEIGGMFITGIDVRPEKKGRNKEERPRNTVFLFAFDGVTVCHLGDLTHVPSQAQVEALGPVNVLLLPVGNAGHTLNAAQAAEVVNLLEPNIVVPMHYKTKGVELKLDPVSKFLKEMGLGEIAPQETLKVAKATLPEETQVVILEIKGT